MYRFADTDGGLRGEVVLLRIYNTSCHGYQGWSKGGGGIINGLMYRVADTKRGFKGEVVFLRVHCIVSGLPRLF